MFHIVLFQPEIPPNTGNIIRLCANTGSHLHLIRPLGFEMDDKKLRRAGLDYREWARVCLYDSWTTFLTETKPAVLYACTTKATKLYTQACFTAGDYLIFGPETRGLPESLLHELGPEHCLRLPMLSSSRSMNLSNAVSVFLYEAWRQLDFAGGG